MIEAPPGRPVQNNPPQLERFHIYLLLVRQCRALGCDLAMQPNASSGASRGKVNDQRKYFHYTNLLPWPADFIGLGAR